MFSYDNKFFDLMNRIMDWFLLSILWIVFSIPVFTFGASTTALFETVHKVLRKDKGYVWRTFWNTFKTNFKRSTIVWMIQLGILLLLFADMKIMQMFLAQGTKSGLLYYFFLVSLGVMYVWVIYTCVYIARIEDNVKVTMKNSIMLALMSLPWAVLVLALFIGTVLLVILFPIGVVIVPTCLFFLYDLILMHVFGKYVRMTDEDKVEDSSEE